MRTFTHNDIFFFLKKNSPLQYFKIQSQWHQESNHISVRLLSYLIVPLILISCNGQAPLLTCQKPCKKPKEERNLFCECYVPDTNKQPIDWVPPAPEGSPQLDWSWENHDGCDLNRHYYLLNFNKHTLLVTVAWKIPNSSDRESHEYRISGNAINRNDGIDLGYEEKKIGSDCFDKDFVIERWREPQHATSKESAFAHLHEKSQEMLEMKSTLIAGLQAKQTYAYTGDIKQLPDSGLKGPKINLVTDKIISQQTIKYAPVNCPEVCDSGDTLRCAIRGAPPDQQKLRAVRDKLRAPITKSEYSAADIYEIFGLQKSSCNRSDIRVKTSKLYNTGQSCAFPIYLFDGDPKPSLALHFPISVKGEKIVLNPTTSGISFYAGVGIPTLLFADYELNSDFGGLVMEAMASDHGIYYQTIGTCIFLGLK